MSDHEHDTGHEPHEAHEAHEAMERRLRASLGQRAQDVEVTPALYERIRRRRRRAAWQPWALGLAGVAAAAVAGFAVLPGLFETPPPAPVVVEPEPTEAEEPTPGDEALAPLPMAVALVTDDLVLRSAEGEVLRSLAEPEWQVRSVAAERDWTPETGVVAFVADTPDGTVVGTLDQTDGGSTGASLVLPAEPNGAGVAVHPAGDAIAWVAGDQLFLLPLASEVDGLRQFPLQDAPDGLVVQQWVDQVDAPTLLATVPGGGAWSLPMDVGDVFDTQPTGPPLELPVGAGVVDAAYTPDLRLVTVTPAAGEGSAAVLTVDDDPVTLPAPLDAATELVLSTTGPLGALVDPTTGDALLLTFGADGTSTQPLDTPASAVAPLALGPDPQPEDDAPDVGEPVPSDPAELGLPVDGLLLGTDGRTFTLLAPNDATSTIEVYPAESEAVLGELAVRPGSTLEDGLVAVESASEGEVSVRFVALTPEGAAPVGDVVVASGEVTGIAWAPDGTHVAFSDDQGLRTVAVGPGGTAGEPLTWVPQGAVEDWVWAEGLDAATSGYVTLRTDAGSTLHAVERLEDAATLQVAGQLDASAQVVLDTHANDGAAVGPTISVTPGAPVALSWSADGDAGGGLADPGEVGALRGVAASGGQVVVVGEVASVEVTLEGRVRALPAVPVAWDVLD